MSQALLHNQRKLFKSLEEVPAQLAREIESLKSTLTTKIKSVSNP
jgi:hypothetical protein